MAKHPALPGGARSRIDAVRGRREEAEKAVRELEKSYRPGSVHSYRIASVHAALGNREAALAWLERAYESRSGYLSLRLRTDPYLDWLGGDPRFAELVRRMNYPDR